MASKDREPYGFVITNRKDTSTVQTGTIVYRFEETAKRIAKLLGVPAEYVAPVYLDP